MKAIIERVRDNVSSYPTQDGMNYVHSIMVGGNEFDYHSKSEKCVKFVEGQEAHFELVDKQTPRGISKRIVPIQAPRQFTPGGGGKKSYGQPKNENRITYLSCLSSVCVLYQQSAKANDMNFVLEMAEKAYQAAISHNDQ